MRYRRKPIEVNAFQLTRSAYLELQRKINGIEPGTSELPAFIRDQVFRFSFDNQGYICTSTQEDWHSFRVDEWVIEDEDSKIYPFNPDSFENVFEPVEPEMHEPAEEGVIDGDRPTIIDKDFFWEEMDRLGVAFGDEGPNPQAIVAFWDRIVVPQKWTEWELTYVVDWAMIKYKKLPSLAEIANLHKKLEGKEDV